MNNITEPVCTSTTKSEKISKLQSKINSFMEQTYFDVQGISSSSIDEAHLAKVLTKLAVGSATVWWSILEVKDFLVLRRKSKILR